MLLNEISSIVPATEKTVFSVRGKLSDHYPITLNVNEYGLVSLEGCPTIVDGNFNCSTNNLKTLKGGPKRVGMDLDCSDNQLSTFEGFPESIGNYCWATQNNFTSLHNIHKHIKQVGGWIDFGNNKITSHVLGVLLIDGLRTIIIDNGKVDRIINKHLSGDRDVFACQEELIEAGLEDFAQL